MHFHVLLLETRPCKCLCSWYLALNFYDISELGYDPDTLNAEW